MSSDQSGWAVIGGSALGGRHVSKGTPNQDAWATETLVHKGQEHVVMAVADGHGGARYVRSDVGSRLAVAVAVEVVADILEQGRLDGTTRKVEKDALSVLPSVLVASWIRRCLAHLADNPFTDEESSRAGARLDDDPLLSYGSTLLIAILSPTRCHLLQLGDGDSLVAMDDGRMVQPLPPDDRLTGSETTSLCLPDADRDFRTATVEQPAPSLVLLSTDGYGVAFADPDWRQSVASDLFDQLGSRGLERVADSLPAWLEESARVGGDDATLALAYRPQGQRRSPARGLSRTGQMVAVGSIAVLVGGVVGWTAANALSESAPPPAASTTTLASTSTTTDSTTTSIVLSDPTTEPGGIGAGGGASADAQRAAIIGFDGVVVEFVPDPDDPEASIVSAPPAPGFSQTAFAWGTLWSIEEGGLFADDDQVEVGIEPELELVGIEHEGDLIWLLSEGGEWLVAYQPDEVCLIFPIQPEGPAQGRDPDVTAPECADPSGNN